MMPIKSTFTRFVACLAIGLLAALYFPPASARGEIHDNAHLFSQSAVDAANTATAQFQQRYKKQFVLETFASVPADKKGEATQNKAAFFKSWMSGRAKELQVNGVYALICMDPRYVEVGAGTETREKGIFTQADLSALRSQLQASLKAQQYDAALSGAVDTVDRAYTANIPGGNSTPAPAVARGSNTAPARSYPNSVPTRSKEGSHMFGLGTLLCVGIGLLIIFTLVKSVFRRNQTGGSHFGGGFGGGGGPNYPTGGPNYGGGYGPGGGGGSGGFGRGFLGGLLGGAVGGYAADKFEHRNDGASSGYSGGDAGSSGGGFDSGGGGFDSGPSDAGGGFGDGASGGDFGGGGDSGGGDSGGGF